MQGVEGERLGSDEVSAMLSHTIPKLMDRIRRCEKSKWAGGRVVFRCLYVWSRSPLSSLISDTCQKWEVPAFRPDSELGAQG
jgi:hypothetical protein